MRNSAMKIIGALAAFCILHVNAIASNYYWVGGSGNWSDYATHWATTSGGTVFHTQVPTSLDNVYFDANSFTAGGHTVTVDTTIAYCKDMDWTGATGNPICQAANTSIELKVFGSLTLINAMKFTFKGKLTFTAVSAGKTINTGAQPLVCSIEFNGAGGEWTMLDSIATTMDISLTYGTLRTNNNNIKCSTFNSYNNNARALNLGTSEVVLTGPFLYTWYVSSSLIIDADSSIIRFTQDHTYFYSEGHTYNIILWDSTGCCGNNNQILGDNIVINKVISYATNVELWLYNLSSSQIDTVIANSLFSAYESSGGGNNNIKYLAVKGNASIEEREGDSITTMIVDGNMLFNRGNHYINNITVHGNLLNNSTQTFDTCTIYGNGSFISDNNHLGILTMTQGKTFTFGANKTQYIDSLIPLSDPGFPIQLVSSDLGVPANVVINRPLCADYLYIHGIHASGSSTLYAGANSNDVANNTGWIFAPCGATGNCSAGFDLYPDTIPHQYYAISTATGALPLSYSWDWGDGNTDTGPYPSHTYDSAGYYAICLTITDSTGCTDTYCYSYNLLKMDNAMIYVNVIAPLFTNRFHPSKGWNLSLYPNPTDGTVTLKGIPSGEVSLKLYDALGREAWRQSSVSNEHTQVIDLSQMNKGIFFLDVRTESGNKIIKVVRY